jgi:hypothetical protein
MNGYEQKGKNGLKMAGIAILMIVIFELVKWLIELL